MDAESLHSCGQPITECVEMRSLSRVLVLHLARFTQGGRKIEDHCAFDMTISAFGRRGTLYAVLEHSGTRDGGHYWGYFRSGDQWYHYNNKYVDTSGTARSRECAMRECKPQPVEERKVLAAKAYVLFYLLDEASDGASGVVDDGRFRHRK